MRENADLFVLLMETLFKKMKEHIIITDCKKFEMDVTSFRYIPRIGEIYQSNSENYIVKYIITETNDHEFITTAFVSPLL